MRSFTIALLIFLINFLPINASAQDHTQTSQENIIYAYKNFSQELSKLLIFSDEFEHYELSYLEERLEQMKLEKNTKLIFMRDHEYYFNSHMFVTMKEIGSDIYINIDKTYIYPNQIQTPFAISQAVVFVLNLLQRGNQSLSPDELWILYKKVERLHLKLSSKNLL